jgi:DNA-binding NtrC family response regulator
MNKGINPTTLVVLDDDAESLREISAILGSHFRVLATSDPRRAMGWIENDESVGIIIVGQVLRTGLGLDVLGKVQELRPAIRRIMITRYEDLSVLITGIHSGAIHRMISKPLARAELVALVAPAQMGAAASSRLAG